MYYILIWKIIIYLVNTYAKIFKTKSLALKKVNNLIKEISKDSHLFLNKNKEFLKFFVKDHTIQKRPRKIWSQDELWQVPPRPGPSQGNLKPKFALSGIKRELLENNTPFK